jgi:hypothetical protein
MCPIAITGENADTVMGVTLFPFTGALQSVWEPLQQPVQRGPQ